MDPDQTVKNGSSVLRAYASGAGGLGFDPHSHRGKVWGLGFDPHSR